MDLTVIQCGADRFKFKPQTINAITVTAQPSGTVIYSGPGPGAQALTLTIPPGDNSLTAETV